ncbi:M23 family metallopeptidase [Aliikangiella maris]|uniref:M23 family metallopeptidase n=2 Tax=Aliikangiella maris TaxID=3162458 RepID=A0ABV3ML60_9GAMM
MNLVRNLLYICLSMFAPFLIGANHIQILTSKPQQGSMIVGKLISGERVYFDKRELVLNDKKLFVFGVGREAPEEISLTIIANNQQVNIPIKIKQRQWKIERVDGLPPAKVNPKSAETIQRIRQEAGLVRQARSQMSRLELFDDAFILPAKGRISGYYGSQRVLNGEPKRPHYGLDIANKTGTPVLAALGGKITLVHHDMFYSGGTLIIDHGYGISSTYIHLNSIDVQEGDIVKQGQQVGTIGATGRATGPHLDWRVNWFDTRLDPQLLINELNN